jgi:hypothetical protein
VPTVGASGERASAAAHLSAGVSRLASSSDTIRAVRDDPRSRFGSKGEPDRDRLNTVSDWLS